MNPLTGLNREDNIVIMELERTRLPVLLVFILAHFYGILASLNLQTTRLAEGTAVVNNQAVSGLYLIGLIVFATFLMLMLYKYSFGALITLWFYSALGITLLLFFTSFLPALIGLAITAVLLVYRIKSDSLWTRNIIDIFSYAGAGAFFGTMIGPLPAFIFLAALAAYDVLSVFYTGHMISLAEEGMDSDTFMGVIYPKEDKKTEKADIKREAEKDAEKVKLGVLGGGDIIAPMIFSISLLNLFGILSSLLTSIGALGVLYTLFIVMHEDSFYPAIPFVGAGAIIGFLLSLIII